MTARAELVLAADQTQEVNSLAASLSMQVSGGAITETATGRVTAQLKPALLVEDSLNLSISGQVVPVTEIVSGTALYLKEPGRRASPASPG